MKRYEEVAEAMRQRIAYGVYQVGDRLPSIRELCREFGISVSTAQAAYARLEDDALVEARPKSGYFLLPRNRPLVLPEVSRPEQRPLDVSQWDQVLALIDQPVQPGVVALSRGTPDLHAASLKPLTRLMSGSYRHRAGPRVLDYDAVDGNIELRRQAVQLIANSGCFLHPDEVLVTAGCQEALSIAVRTLTQPGDVVAVDSPSFYGATQILRAHGLKALEIPTDPQTGMSLEALELALEQWPIRVIQVTPTCNNPSGYTMSNSRKRSLLRLAQRFDVDIIEDDVYGDLSFERPRPKTIKAFDYDGRVLLCSSVSKTLAPALRVGWIAPGRYRDRAMHMKYVSAGTSAVLPQLAVADFVAKGHYEPHLRAMVRQYRANCSVMLQWVQHYMPEGTVVTPPRGGFVLWVQLPDGVDSVQLNNRLERVTVAPGALFSVSNKYRNCMRLNYASPPTDTIAAAIKTVGDTAAQMLP